MEKVTVKVKSGNSPLVLGLPHVGTLLTKQVNDSLNDRGRILSDTDWHIDRLYDGLIDDISTVSATFHRYVIDLNRDPSGRSLYPGQNTTELVPLTDFDGNAIWSNEPSTQEIQKRISEFHSDYHNALKLELERVKSIHGFVILYDCHSIRSIIPNLFEGVLPDLNIGTNKGASCDPLIERIVVDTVKKYANYSNVLNGRFTGGWTTRNYGVPKKGYHAIQMELAQSAYLSDENVGWEYDDTKADLIRITLTDILTSLAQWKPLLGDN